MPKDQIDDRLRIKAMPDLGMSLDNIANTYNRFLNSQNKAERITFLNDMRNACLDAAQRIKILMDMFDAQVFEGAMPSVNQDLTLRVRQSIGQKGDTMALHGAFLNLDQLAKAFVWPSRKAKTNKEFAEEKIQILFQMYIVTNDLADLCLSTSAEPEKQLNT